MRIKVLAFAASLLLISDCSAGIRQSTSSTSSSSQVPVQCDAQALAMLQSALVALGGAAETASIVASGTHTQFLADSTTVSVPLRVEILGYDRFRWEVDTPDQGTVVTVVSGTTAWRQSAEGTEWLTISQIPGTTFESFPALYVSNWLSSSAVAVKMIGTESLAGNTVYHISITPTLGGNTDPKRETIYETTHQRDLFVDQKTNLPVRLRYFMHPTDWRVAIPVDVEYSNFQVVSGIAFPTTVTSYLGDSQISQIQYQSIKLNAPVAASDFAGGPQ